MRKALLKGIISLPTLIFDVFLFVLAIIILYQIIIGQRILPNIEHLFALGGMDPSNFFNLGLFAAGAVIFTLIALAVMAVESVRGKKKKVKSWVTAGCFLLICVGFIMLIASTKMIVDTIPPMLGYGMWDWTIEKAPATYVEIAAMVMVFNYLLFEVIWHTLLKGKDKIASDRPILGGFVKAIYLIPYSLIVTFVWLILF